MAIYVKILKNHIYVDFVKIQEFILVIIFVIFPQKWQFLNFLGIQPINGLFGSVTVMLMTSLCWWLYDGDWFQILVAECWRFFRYVGDFLNVLNRSPNLSHICHTFGLQHPSPTSMSPFGSDWLTWKPIWEIFLSKQILEVILLVENIWNQMKLELHLLWWLMIKVSILEQLLFVIETHFNKKEFLRRIYQVRSWENEINVEKCRIRHTTTLESNYEFLDRFPIEWRRRHWNSESFYVESDSFRHWLKKWFGSGLSEADPILILKIKSTWSPNRTPAGVDFFAPAKNLE